MAYASMLVFLGLAILTTLVVVVDASHHTSTGSSPTGSSPATDDDDTACDTSVDDLMTNCKAYVVPGLLGSPPLPSNPSPCCSAVQAAHFPCICSRATGPVMSFVDKQAVKNVLQACDVVVPSGTTCGGTHTHTHSLSLSLSLPTYQFPYLEE